MLSGVPQDQAPGRCGCLLCQGVFCISPRRLDRCALGLCFSEVTLTHQQAPQSYAKLAGATERRQRSMNLKAANTHVVTTQQHLPEGTTAGVHITHQLLFSWDLARELPERG